MSTETVCRICSHWKLSPLHQCPPVFHCRRQGERPWIRVHGRSSSAAAETFSERQPDFCLMTREFMVEVKGEDAGDEDAQVFLVAKDHTVEWV